jgi:hypothetical protein
MLPWVIGAAIALVGVIAFLLVGRFVFKGAPSLAVPDGRLYWSFLAILGGCIVFTIMAAVGVWLVSDNPKYSLYLALAAHFQIFVGMSTFGFVLGRRMRGKAGKGGLEWDDSGEPPKTPKEAAERVVGAAEEAAAQIPPGKPDDA